MKIWMLMVALFLGVALGLFARALISSFQAKPNAMSRQPVIWTDGKSLILPFVLLPEQMEKLAIWNTKDKRWEMDAVTNQNGIVKYYVNGEERDLKTSQFTMSGWVKSEALDEVPNDGKK